MNQQDTNNDNFWAVFGTIFAGIMFAAVIAVVVLMAQEMTVAVAVFCLMFALICIGVIIKEAPLAYQVIKKGLQKLVVKKKSKPSLDEYHIGE